MRAGWTLLTAVAILPACSSGDPAPVDPNPAEFRALPDEMSASLEAFQARVDAAGPGGTVTFGAPLFTASGAAGRVKLRRRPLDSRFWIPDSGGWWALRDSNP